MDHGPPATLLPFSTPTTPAICPPLGIGLLSPWRSAPRRCLTVTSAPRMCTTPLSCPLRLAREWRLIRNPKLTSPLAPLRRRRILSIVADAPPTQRSSTPIPLNDPNIPPRSLHGDSQPRGGYSDVGPQTMSRNSPAPPLARESASRHRGRTDTPRPSPPPAPRDTPSKPEERRRASRHRGGLRDPPSTRGSTRPPYTRPATSPPTRNSVPAPKLARAMNNECPFFTFPPVLSLIRSAPARGFVSIGL